ncbi:MAG: dihydropteroate synthase [Alphaproteobacteria bacterium]|nr:dihydropteroate synthase [Alphaproteobacteria bacterium]
MAGQPYFRPIAQTDRARPGDARALAGGASWFSHVEVLVRGQGARVVPVADIPTDVATRISAPRAPICGFSLERPRLMGVLNVTPDSFSDGGQFERPEAALAQAHAMVAAGADILDIGGESTRPGADFVPAPQEITRTAPVIAALADVGAPISIDTRKAGVAAAAMRAGAGLINDVSAFEYDPKMLEVARSSGAVVCLMHASGDPKTMQDKPAYDDVLLDVYDYLERRVAYCEARGISRTRIMVDPGIGFGKTQAHNLALIRGLSLFHGLGCAILLGVSRKRFIGVIGDAPIAAERAPGSLALGLEGLRQGVQMLRVHDIRETRQAVSLWRAAL